MFIFYVLESISDFDSILITKIIVGEICFYLLYTVPTSCNSLVVVFLLCTSPFHRPSSICRRPMSTITPPSTCSITMTTAARSVHRSSETYVHNLIVSLVFLEISNYSCFLCCKFCHEHKNAANIRYPRIFVSISKRHKFFRIFLRKIENASYRENANV